MVLWLTCASASAIGDVTAVAGCFKVLENQIRTHFLNSYYHHKLICFCERPPVDVPVIAPKIMSSMGMPIRGRRTEI